MQHAPHVDVVRPLDVEYEVRVARQRPSPQAGQIKLVGVAWGTRGRMEADVGAGLLQRIDEAERGCLGGFAQE